MHQLFSVLRAMLRRRDFVSLILCNLTLGLTYAFVIPFVSLFFTEEVGMSPLLFGVFMTVTTLSGIALSTVVARWSDVRFSRNQVMFVSGLLGALGYAGNAYARDPVALFALGAVPLSISGVCFSQTFAMARDLLARSGLPESDTPLYMNIFRICFAVAWMGGPALSAWVQVGWGFKGAYLTAASLFLLFAVLAGKLLPSIPPSEAARKAAVAMPWRKAMQIPGLLAYFIGFTLYSCASTLGMMNLPLLLVKTLGGKAHDVGIAYSVAPVFEVPFMYWIGLLATRRDHGGIIRVSILMATAYYAALVVVGKTWQVYPLQVVSAAIVAVTSGIAITFFQNFLPNQAGTATNLYSNANRAGALLGYLLFGWLSTFFGQASARTGDITRASTESASVTWTLLQTLHRFDSHRAVFAVCSLLSLAAFVMIRRVGRTPSAAGG